MSTQGLEKAQQIAANVLAGVSADQMDNDTPCASWKVSDLVDHMVGAQHWATAAINGVKMTETGEGSAQGDFSSTFKAAAQQTVDGFSADGAMDRMVDPGFGQMPAGALLGMATMDTFAHAWDLATATGQDADLDPEFAEQLLGAAKASIQDSFRGPEGAPFGPATEAPAGATSAQQLAAFLGRTL